MHCNYSMYINLFRIKLQYIEIQLYNKNVKVYEVNTLYDYIYIYIHKYI